MKFLRPAHAVIAAALLSPVALDAATAPAKDLALVGGRLIDGWGGAPVNRSVVLVEGERIKAVGTEGKFADLIAVKGDMLRYIDLLQRVDVVIKHGVRVK